VKPRARLLAVAVMAVLPGAAGAVERVPLPEIAPLPERASATWGIAMPEFLQHFGIESWWDVVQFQPWTASLALSFDDHEHRLKSPGVSTARSSSRLGTETFTIRNDNFAVIDPRLFTGSLALGMMFVQARQQAQDRSSSESGQLGNYSFSGNFLPDSAYTGAVTAIRNRSTYVLPSGTTTDSDYEGRALVLNLRENSILRDRGWLPYFTASLRVAEQNERQTTTTGAQSFRQDSRRRSVLFDFQNGGETSDLIFQYQFTKLDNHAYADGSYDSQSANLHHSLDFGPTLNWRLDSRVNYYERKGVAALSELSTLDVSEFLTIDHNVNRSSHWNYQLTRQDSSFGVATTQAAGVQYNEQLYSNLSLAGGLTGVYSTLPGGTITNEGVSGNFSYSRNLPWGGHLSLTGGGGYAQAATKVPAGFAPVVDAPYAVPQQVGAGSAIVLKDRNIDVATIKVTVLKGGARVAAFEGADYTVRVEGDRTSLLPVPSSALMLPGDPVNVSYLYFVDPDSAYATSSRSASLSVDWDWVGFSASRDQSEQKPISGGETLLVDQRRDFGQVYVRGEWEGLSARGVASIVDYGSSRLAYREHRLEQYLSWAPSYNLLLAFSGNQHRTQFRLPEHTTRGGAYRVDLQWTTGGWITSGHVGRRTYSDTRQPNEVVDETGLRTRRTWSKLDFNLAVGAQRRLRGEVSSTNGFFHIGVVRRF
jgi:hypothetical protein